MPYSKAESSVRIEVTGAPAPTEWLLIAAGLGCAGLIATIIVIAVHESEKRRLMTATLMS
jgi:hypothetical protein